MALLVSVLTKKDLSLSLFATAPGVVGLLYLGALAGLLRPTAIVLFYAGFAAGVAAVAYAFHERKARTLLAEVLSPGPLLLATGAVAYWVSYRGAAFAFWDEFNNWGIAVKEMYFTNSLPVGGSAIVYQDYPRGTALFQYFFARNAFWGEDVVYFAHFVLSAVPFVVLFRGARWRSIHRVALTLVFALLLCYMGGPWLRILYVDFALAAYFGVLLAVYLTSDASPSTIAMLIPAIFMMPLVKKPGLGFAGVCAAIIWADLLLRRLFSDAPDAGLAGGIRVLRNGFLAVIRWLIHWMGTACGSSKAFAPILVVALAVAAGVPLVMGAQWPTAIQWALSTGVAAVLLGVAWNLRTSNRMAALFALGILAAFPLDLFVGWRAAAVLIAALLVVATLSSARCRTILAGNPAAIARTAVVALVIAAPLAAEMSWQSWIASHNVKITHDFGNNRTYASALKSFGKYAMPFDIQTRHAFMEALSSKPVARQSNDTLYASLREKWPFLQKAPDVKPLTTVGYSIALLLLFGAAFRLLPGAARRVRLVVPVAFLFAGFCAYMVCLLADYLMGINPPDGQRLLEFHRYAWGYIMAVVILAWGVIAAAGDEARKAGRMRGAVTLAILAVFTLYLYVFENQYWSIAVKADPSSASTTFTSSWQSLPPMLQERIEFAKQVMRPDEEAFVVSPNGGIIDCQFVGYQFFPRRTSMQYFADRGANYTTDPLGGKVSPEQWQLMLAKFSYVFVIRDDERFCKEYESLFSSDRKRGDFLFRVSHKPSGEMILEPVRMNGGEPQAQDRTAFRGQAGVKLPRAPGGAPPPGRAAVDNTRLLK